MDSKLRGGLIFCLILICFTNCSKVNEKRLQMDLLNQIQQGNTHNAKELIDSLSDVNYIWVSDSPLHVACRTGNHNLIKSLLLKGADIFKESPQDQMRPIDYLIWNDEVDYLIKIADSFDIDLRRKSSNGQTLIYKVINKQQL